MGGVRLPGSRVASQFSASNERAVHTPVFSTDLRSRMSGSARQKDQPPPSPTILERTGRSMGKWIANGANRLAPVNAKAVDTCVLEMYGANDASPGAVPLNPLDRMTDLQSDLAKSDSPINALPVHQRNLLLQVLLSPRPGDNAAALNTATPLDALHERVHALTRLLATDVSAWFKTGMNQDDDQNRLAILRLAQSHTGRQILKQLAKSSAAQLPDQVLKSSLDAHLDAHLDVLAVQSKALKVLNQLHDKANLQAIRNQLASVQATQSIQLNESAEDLARQVLIEVGEGLTKTTRMFCLRNDLLHSDERRFVSERLGKVSDWVRRADSPAIRGVATKTPLRGFSRIPDFAKPERTPYLKHAAAGAQTKSQHEQPATGSSQRPGNGLSDVSSQHRSRSVHPNQPRPLGESISDGQFKGWSGESSKGRPPSLPEEKAPLLIQHASARPQRRRKHSQHIRPASSAPTVPSNAPTKPAKPTKFAKQSTDKADAMRSRSLSKVNALIDQMKRADIYTFAGGYQTGVSSHGITTFASQIASTGLARLGLNAAVARVREAQIQFLMNETYLEIMLGSTTGLDAELGISAGLGGPDIPGQEIVKLPGITGRLDPLVAQAGETRGIVLRIPCTFHPQSPNDEEDAKVQAKLTAKRLLQSILELPPDGSLLECVAQEFPEIELRILQPTKTSRISSRTVFDANAIRLSLGERLFAVGARVAADYMWRRRYEQVDYTTEIEKVARSSNLRLSAQAGLDCAPGDVGSIPLIGQAQVAAAIALDEMAQTWITWNGEVSRYSFRQLEFSSAETARAMVEQLFEHKRISDADRKKMLAQLDEWDAPAKPDAEDKLEAYKKAKDKMRHEGYDSYFAIRIRVKPEVAQELSSLNAQIALLKDARRSGAYSHTKAATDVDDNLRKLEERRSWLMLSPENWQPPVLRRHRRITSGATIGSKHLGWRQTVTVRRMEGKVEAAPLENHTQGQPVQSANTGIRN